MKIKKAVTPPVLSLSGRKITGRGWTRGRAERHTGLDMIALRKRRAKNKVARISRRKNRSR